MLILDEPTAALNEDDSENLLELIRELKEQGVTCIMISHKLKEITAIADTITVLRDGSTICSMNTAEHMVTEAEIIKHMVGREIDNIYPKREKKEFGDVCLEIKDWTVFDSIKQREILHQVNMKVHKGEIVGLQGLMGAGRTELALSLFGNTPGYKITSGEILLNGESQYFKNPKAAIKAGVAYVTEDRKGNGLVLIQNIKYNTSLANLEELTEGLAINENEEINIANEYKKSINIKAPSIMQKVGNLSGGNQQKVQLAKWLFVKPQVLILDEPTRGIDVGAKYEIYQLILNLANEGKTVLMVSSEMPELLGVCDRIVVMSGGRVAGEVDARNTTQEEIMTLAAKYV